MNKNLIDWDHQQKSRARRTNKQYENDIVRESVYAANGIIMFLTRHGIRPSRKDQMRIATKMYKTINYGLKSNHYNPKKHDQYPFCSIQKIQAERNEHQEPMATPEPSLLDNLLSFFRPSHK